MMSIIVVKGPFTSEEVRRISAVVQDIESVRPDELFEVYVDADDMEGEAEALMQAMTPPPLPGYSRTEKRWDRSKTEHHYRITWQLPADDITVKAGMPERRDRLFDGVDGQCRAREHLKILRDAEAAGILTPGSIVVERQVARVERDEWKTVQEVDNE